MRRILFLCLNVVFIEWTESQTATLRGPRLQGPRLLSQTRMAQSGVAARGPLQVNTPVGRARTLQTGSVAGLPAGMLENSLFSGISVHSGGQIPESNFRQTGHFDLNSQSVIGRRFGSTPPAAGTGQETLGNAHVDWPGMHGNTGNRPVLHRQAPVTLDGATIVDISPSSGLSGNIRLPQNTIVPSGSTPGQLRHIDIPVGAHIDMPGEHGNTEGVAALHIPDTAVGGPNAHVDLPMEHGNTASVPMIHLTGGQATSHVPAIPSDPLVGFAPGTHVDLPNEHGNTASFPVLHIPDNTPPHIGGPGALPGQPDPLADFAPGTHVDLPNEHGNTGSFPVLHIPDNTPPHIGGPGALPGQPDPLADFAPGTHVDLPNEHGNTGSFPVLHIPDNTPPHIGGPGALPGQPDPLADFAPGTHVDLPNEHGNTGSFPVLHIPDNTPPHIGGPGALPGQPDPLADFAPGTHVDLPNEHGNTGSFPVLHIPDNTPPHIGGPGALPGQPDPLADFAPGTHVDLPNEHGNTGSFPVLHIPDQTPPHIGGFGALPGQPDPLADFAPGTHVDLPNEHGNTASVSVLHIPDNTPPNSGGPGALPGITHVDFPFEHGNMSPVPVIHRPNQTPMPLGGRQIGTGATPPSLSDVLQIQTQGQVLNIPDIPADILFNTPFPDTVTGNAAGPHIDMPGEHGNTASVPALHIPDPQTTPLDNTGLIPGLPATVLDTSPTSHIDLPFEHGNRAGVPVVHIPDTNPSALPNHVPSFTDIIGVQGDVFGSQTARDAPGIMSVLGPGAGIIGGAAGYPRTRGWRADRRQWGRQTPQVTRRIDRLVQAVPAIGSTLMPRRRGPGVIRDAFTSVVSRVLPTAIRDLGSMFGLDTVDLTGRLRSGPAVPGRSVSYQGVGARSLPSRQSIQGRQAGVPRLPLLDSVFRTVRRVTSSMPTPGTMRSARRGTGLLDAMTRLSGGRL